MEMVVEMAMNAEARNLIDITNKCSSNNNTSQDVSTYNPIPQPSSLITVQEKYKKYTIAQLSGVLDDNQIQHGKKLKRPALMKMVVEMAMNAEARKLIDVTNKCSSNNSTNQGMAGPAHLKWNILLERFPWGCFLAQGGAKQVFKVYNACNKKEEAISVMYVW
jgi:hypothetical protein